MVVISPNNFMSEQQQDNRNSQYQIKYMKLDAEKTQLSQASLEQLEHNNLITATIKVARPGYVPQGVEVRAQISPKIFTANLRSAVLEKLQNDPEVISIQPAKHLRSL